MFKKTKIWPALKSWILGRDPNDIHLNQPLRALLRAVLWFVFAVAMVLPLLGTVCELATGINGLNPGLRWLLANLAGLFLSFLPTVLLVMVLYLIVLVGWPVLRSSSVPRAVSGRRK
jgi:hypothetical protein